MVHIFCKFCLISVEAAEWGTHIVQTPHLQELPLKIVVRGSYNEEQVKQLFAYFSTFGAIKEHILVSIDSDTTLECEFWNDRVYSQIIHQEHNFLGEDLEISWYKKPNTGSIQYIVQDEKMHSEKYIYRQLNIINAIQKNQTIFEELQTFQNQLENIKIKSDKFREIIRQDLKQAITTQLPNSEIIFFGSSITELEIHNSNINIYLNNTDSNISTLQQIRDLITTSEKFTKISLNIESKVPYIKSQHKKSKLICNINIKNELPIAKSELIKFYSTFDEKLRIFMLLIKFWADCHELKQETGFSSYCIDLLIIFYLQQVPYSLPSVADLQQHISCNQIEGWNCNFGSTEFTNPVLERATITDLLEGFFKFYSEFNYGSYVISPYCGSFVDKTLFLDSSKLPEYLRNYKNQQITMNLNPGLCLQDIFELSENISFQLPLNLAAKFSALCRNSLELLQSDVKDLLRKLFLFVPNNNSNEFWLNLDDVNSDKVNNCILKILKEICFCQVEYYTSENTEIYSCKSEYNIWDHRLEFLKNCQAESDIEREIKLSSLLVKKSIEKFYWEMEVCVIMEVELSKSKLVFRGNSDIIFHIGHFIYIILKQTLLQSRNENFGRIEFDTSEILVIEKTEIHEENLIPISDLYETEDINETKINTVLVLPENTEKEHQNLAETERPETNITEEAQPQNKLVDYSSGDSDNEEVPKSPIISETIATDFQTLKVDITENCKKIPQFINQIIYFINKITTYENDVRPIIQKIHRKIEKLIGSDNLSGYIFDWSYLRFLASNEIESEQQLHSFKKTMNRRGFRDVVSYTENDNIFIECRHKKMLCKLCLSNKRPIQNIQVLEYYMDLDDKIRILFNFVQFWVICYDIYPHIDSDAIYILIIFYLQQEPYNLPSISKLQENTEADIEFGWNRAFNAFDYNPTTLENYTFFDIIHGFFKFYEKFDYMTYVISPFSGCLVEKISFLEPFDLPFCYQDYMNQEKNLNIDSYICIQDPFEHSTNLRFDPEAESFSYLCRTSLDLMNQGESHLLSNLVLYASDCKFVDYYSFFLKRDHTEELQWKCFVRALISTFFEKVLACDVEVLSIKPDEYTYIIKGEIKIIQNRNQVYKILKKDFMNDMKELDKEIAITSHINRYFPITQRYWTMTISVEFLSEPSGVKISNKGVFSRRLEGPLFHFIRVKLGTFLENNTQDFLASDIKTEANDLETNDGDGIFQKLQKGTTLLQQLEILYNSLISPKSEVEKNYELILKDLKLIFVPPQSIYLFGSKSLHLDFKTDFYDIYIDLINAKYYDVERQLKQTGKFSDFSYYRGCLCCRHNGTQTVLRLTIKNNLLLKTTNVIKYYISYDRKIPLLVMLVKFCIHQFGLTKDGFSSYSVYLLVIFYLQQKPYCFPPISKLQEIALDTHTDVCFNNCLLNWSIFDLITGFFTFYGNFDYSKYAICTYIGVAVEKEKFLKPYELAEDYSDYVNQNLEMPVNSRFCIQDIYDHTKNITKSISLDKCGKFAVLCRMILVEVSTNYDLSLIKDLSCDFLKFEIEKNTTGSFEVWKKCVEICTSDILKQVLCCQNRQTSIATFPIYPDPLVTIYHYQKPIQIWEDRIKRSKQIDKKIKGIERDALITSEILKWDKHIYYEDIQITLSFQPEKVEFSLRGKHDMVHVTHIIYLNLIKLLQLTSSSSNTESILEGKIWNLSVEDNKNNEDDFKKQVKIQIPSNTSFEEQITNLMNLLKTNDNELQDKTTQIRDDLVQILPPLNEIIFIGSSVLGLFTQESTVDIYINLKKIQELTYLKELLTSSQKFTEVKLTERFTNPVFKCEHKTTKLTCLIYLDLRLGFYQTEILKYYINIDQKIKTLMMFVRFWGDCVGLKNQDFTNYVFSLLVIFYLQQKPYNLPSVSELKEIVLPQKIQGFSTNIMPLQAQSPALQQATIFDLIYGFFEFYSKFDYISYVVTPFSGNLINKIDFTPVEDFNNKSFVFKIWLCLQDPVELSRNLLADMDHKFTGIFTSKCRYSVILMKTGEKHLVSDLLTPEAKMNLFEIYSENKIHYINWTWKVMQNFQTIITEMFQSSATTDEKFSCSFFVGDFIQKYDVKSLRQILSGCSNPLTRKKYNRLMFHLMIQKIKHELRVEIIFNSCPQRATFYFVNTTSDFFYHYIHILYVKTLDFMFQKTAESRDGIYSILDGKSWDENAVVFDKKLSYCRNIEEQNQKEISADLIFGLSESFSGIEISFYNTSITGLGNKSLSIYISNVPLHRGTSELFVNLLTKSGKFETVMISSDIEVSIKSRHVKTQVFCEINIKKQQSLTTSEFIKFFQSADEKVSLLMVIVKFWADSFNSLLSNDAILLLVVFFLQDQYKFPSVMKLESEKPWKIQDFHQTYKNLPLFDLLLEFFTYYATFDSTQHLISPYFGSVIEKTRFLKPYDLPDYFKDYINKNEELTIRSVLDIQDPFQLSKNLTEEIDPQYLEMFAYRCYLAAKNLLTKCDLASFLKKSAGNIKNFIYVFDRENLDCMKIIVTKILRDGFGYETIESNQPVYTFECSGGLYLYHNQAFAAKIVDLVQDSSDLDKTIAIAKTARAHFNQTLGTLHMNVKLEFKDDICMLEIQHSRKKVTPLLTHLLYIRIIKALTQLDQIKICGDVLIEDNLSEQIENQTNTVLNDLQVITTFSLQVTTLQKVFILTEIQSDQNKVIEADLRSILSSLKIKKIVTTSRISMNENLYIYLDFEENENNTVEEIATLISKSESFIHLKSQSTIICNHRKTNIICVININYKFYEENEKLMEFYFNLDEKILSLIFIIQFWAHRHKLTEIYGFSSKAINLLVIFFLQQEPYKLPSVAKLQDNVKPVMKFGWNSVLVLEGNASQKLKDCTLLELVCRFFEFYAKFDYISNIVSVYSGCVIAKEYFLKPYNLPDFYKNYVKQDKALSVNSSICIQDCYDHSLSITADVPLYFSGRFACLCRSASKLHILLESTYLYNVMKFDNNLTSFEIKKSQNYKFDDLIDFFENILRKMIACGLHIQLQTSTLRRYVFSGKYNIWNDRIKTLKKLNVTFPNQTEKEVTLSKYIMHHFAQRLWTKFCVSLSDTEDSYKVEFEFCDFNLCYHMSYFIYLQLLNRWEIDTPSLERQEVEVEQPTSPPSVEVTNNLDNLDLEIDQKPILPIREQELASGDNLLALMSEGSSIQDVKEQSFEDETLSFYTNFLKQKEQRQKNLKKLHLDLMSCFGHRKIYIYGSSATGLDLPDSDVNISVDWNSDDSETIQSCTTKSKLIHSGNFENVSITLGSKLTCQHAKTKLHVTIDCSGEIGIHQTEFIKYYLTLDEKLPLFITLLKTWADKNEFFKKYCFTGYAITLMVFFFLQQEFKLPSIAELQKDTFCYKVGDWNCAFTKIDRIYTQLKKFKIGDLLKRFFKFYGDFDYFSFVLAPFFGYPVAKTRFLKPFTLPEVYSFYINKDLEIPVDNGLCIQDIFQQSTNIANSVSYQNIGMFAACCRYSGRVMQFCKENLLRHLLQDKLDSNNSLCSFSIKNFGPLNEEQWIQCVKLLIYKILTNVFVGKIIHTKDTTNRVEYRCEGFIDIWKQRIKVLKTALKKLSRTATAVDKEIAITTSMDKDQLKKISWLLSLEILFKKDPLRISVSVKANYENYHICHFLYTRLVKFLICEGSRNSCVAIDVEKVTPNRNSNTDKLTKSKKQKTSDSQALNQTNKLKSDQIILSQQENLELIADQSSSMTIQTDQDLSTTIPPKTNLLSKSSVFENKKIKIKTLKNTCLMKNFQDQVNLLCNKLLKTKEEILELKKSLRLSLQTVLRSKFEFDDILFFGSLANGLFTDGSSCDIYIDNLKSIEETDENILELLQKVITESKLFIGDCEIFGDIILCKHTVTQIDLEIYTKSKSFIYSSSLINYYLTRDPKIPQLLFVLKCWLECIQLPSFTSYTITIMVIFYLQQAPYKLSSLAQLQRPCKAVIRENWNVAFTQIKFNDFYLKNASLKDLIVGFFEFYSNFDYFSYVISPYIGQALRKTKFLSPVDLPNQFYLYKKRKIDMNLDSSICIQDFFDHSKNIAKDINLINMGRFACLCRNALQLVYPKSEEQLLYRFLSQYHNSKLVDYRGFELEMEDFFDEKQWIQALINSMDCILKKIFGCKITQTETKNLNNENNTIIGNKVRTGEITQITYNCVSNHNIWRNRVKIEKQLKLKNDVLSDINNDIVISNKIIKTEPQSSNKWELNIEFTIMSNPTSVRIGVTGNKFDYIQFLYTRIKSALEKAIIKGEIGKKQDSESWSLAASVITAPYKILVTGSFNSTDVSTLHEYFGNFDKILALKMIGDTKMAIEYCFADPKNYLKIIQQQHLFNGDKLNVIPLAPLKKYISNAEFRDWRLTFIHNTTEKDTFDEQINILLNQLKTINVGDHKKLIEHDCNAVLSKVFYKSKIRFLGFDFEYDNLDFCVVNLPQTTTKQAFLRVLKNMLSQTARFQNVTLQDKNSVIRFKHVSTQLSCFLRIKNKGDSDTFRLLKNYLKVNDKILKFLTVIKFWADFYELTNDSFFSNTSLYFMVIFYLQQEPYNLPTVKKLQENTKHNLQEAWNYSFMECKEVSTNLKLANFEDLLCGFFKFYSNFDYISYVISPYFGSGLLKTRFLKPYNLPDGFQEYIRLANDLHVDSGVCVQDFFEHDRNIASSVSLNSMGVFTTLCRSSLDLMKYGRKLLLYKVLLNCHHSIFEFPTFFLKKNPKMSEEEWMQSIKTYTLKILTEVLNYRLSQIPDFGVNHACYNCIGQHNIWENRIKAWKMISSESEGITKEIIISKKVIRIFPEEISWNLNLELTFLKHPSKVKFTFIQKTECHNIFHICHFFYTRLKFLFESKQIHYGTEFEMNSAPEINEIIIEDDSPDVIIVEPPLIDLTCDEDITQNSPDKSKDIQAVEEDDDIPSDFFDDFSNEDFLEGLDIIDAWDYESAEAINSREKSLSKERLPVETSPIRSKSKSSSRSTNSSVAKSRSVSRHKTRSRSKHKSRTRSRAVSRSRSRTRNKRSNSHSRIRSKSISRERRVRSRSRSVERTKRKRRSSSSSSLGKERVYRRSRSRSPCKFKKKKKSSSYRARKRSASREERKSNSPKPIESKKRKTFLEEITEKLNEIHNGSSVALVDNLPTNSNVIPTPVPPPAPQPVPPPTEFLYTNPVNFPSLPIASVPGFSDVTVYNTPGTSQDITPSLNLHPTSVPLPTSLYNENVVTDQLLQLFTEKKISISEFLTRTAKGEASNNPPSITNINKKIKVLCNMQEIINFMTPPTVLDKFILKPSTQVFKPGIKNCSPLKKSVVRFHFTTPVKQSFGQNFTNALKQILQKVGDNLKSLEDFDLIESENFAGRNDSAKTEAGVQCNIPLASISIGIQVDEEDLRSANNPKMGFRKEKRSLD